MNKPLSVSELNRQIHSLLETTFSNISVEGEISNLTYHSSGHIYFSLKDDKSTLSAVMFRGNANKLKFRLEVGQKVLVRGSMTVYVPRGNYQIICSDIQPSGIGALALAYEQLKTKLQIKGYFDSSIKKTVPKLVQNIFVVTSNTGAAIEDMKKILAHRYPLAKMVLVPALVQGEGAKESIVRGIKFADSLAFKTQNSVIIVGRGGGSIEDLWAFNEEIVADAIYEAKSLIVSAVGHESDFVISDFVADIRASTPSNAIELVTPNIDDLKIYVDNLANELSHKTNIILQNKISEFNAIKEMYKQQSFSKKFELANENITNLSKTLTLTMEQKLLSFQNQIDFLEKNFSSHNPSKKLSFGFVQVTRDDEIIDIDKQNIDEIINLESTKYKFECKIIDKQEIS